MNLSRELLENEYFQKLALTSTNPNRPAPLTREQMAQSLAQTLSCRPAGAPVWIFGYGSLIWNPLFEFEEQALVTLHGYRRRFCLKTELSRGTPEFPGLVLGLEPGGSCRGVTYRLPSDTLDRELQLLWRREMVTGAYQPRWVTLRDQQKRSITGLAFVMNLNYPFYAPGLSDEQTAQVLARAHGPLGSCAEYLFNTHTGLTAHGIIDAHLHKLVERVRELQDNASATTSARKA